MWSWGTLPQAPSAAHTPSAPHFWELNISPGAAAGVRDSVELGFERAFGLGGTQGVNHVDSVGEQDAII